jgi:PGDYG protein
MKNFKAYLSEAEANRLSDDWFADGFKTYKRPTPERYEIAKHDGSLQTLEGPVKYKAGYYILTGPKGEQYPIPPEKFAELKEDQGRGVCTPKKIMKVAKLADHDGVVNTSWGEPLNYTAGNDYIVRHGPNDYGVVKKDIFTQTYEKA